MASRTPTAARNAGAVAAGALVPDPPECGSIDTAIEAVRRLFVDYVQYEHIVNDNPPQTPARRAAFIKQHGGAYATFQVADDLPAQYCVGIFQQGAHYDAWIRFSSDIPDSEPDFQSTVGVGIKLFGVAGPKVLQEDAQATTLDLVLQNTPQFFAADAMEMCSFKYANIQSKVQADPTIFAAWRAAHPRTDEILKEMAKPVKSMLTEKLWSCIPYKFGKDQDGNDVYCKYILQNRFASQDATPVPDATADANYLSTDLQTRLKNGPPAGQGPTGEDATSNDPQPVPSTNAFVLDFYVQIRSDPQVQSLTDARVVWDENEAKPFKVATLSIPQQDITVRGQADYSEALSYSIWRTLPEMAPVGSIAEMRKVVYQSSAQMRRNVNGQSIGEPAKPRPPGPPTPPFAPGYTWNNTLAGAGSGAGTDPPAPAATLFIAGQRSTTFVYEDGTKIARAKIQTLMGLIRQAGAQASPVSPRVLTWRYDDGAAHTGKYFLDIRPERALTVSAPGDPAIAPVILAPCGVAQTPLWDAVLLSGHGATAWQPGDAAPGQNVPNGAALAGCNAALAVIGQDGSVTAFGDDATLTAELQALAGAAGMAATQSGFATLSTSGGVSQQGQAPGTPLPPLPAPAKCLTSTLQAYCAVDQAGGITAWGAQQSGGDGAPSPPFAAACVGVVPTLGAFAALMDGGDVRAWGDSSYGADAPPGLGDAACLAATAYAYAALKTDGTVVAWGLSATGGTAPASLADVVQLAGAWSTFAALKEDGTVAAWGNDELVQSLPASLDNVISVIAAERAFAALRADGTVVIWGKAAAPGGSDPATWTGIVAIQSAGETFYAIDSSGGVHAWGSDAAHMPPAPALTQMQGRFSFFGKQA